MIQSCTFDHLLNVKANWMLHTCYKNHHCNMISVSLPVLIDKQPSLEIQFPCQGGSLFVRLDVNLSLTWTLPRQVVGIMDGQGHNSRQ